MASRSCGRIFDGLLQRDVQLGRHHLGDAVDVGVRDVHGAAHVFDGGLRGHGAEGDDLGDVVAAVFLRDVLDDFAAAVHAEIDVDVGHGHALGIQEALEEQFVLQRVDVGDAERVGDQRSGGRSAAGADRNVVLFGVADEVPDDQEISGELHLLDDAEFALQALLVVGDGVLQLALLVQRAQRFQAAGEAFAGDVNEVAVDGVAGRNFELRKRIGDFFQAQAAALGDVERAREHLGRIFEHAGHFVVVLDEELVAVELHARGVVNRLAGLDAEHHVLRVGVVFAEVVAVVGGDQRQAEIFFQLEEAGMDAVLHLQALILNLEKEILFAENVGVGSGGRAGGIVVAFRQAFGDFAFQASGEADQAAGMLGEKLLADARLVVKAMQRGLGSDLDQIAVAFFVFGEHQQMVVGVAFGGGAVVVFLADVEFAADDGLHSRMLARR